MSSGIYNTDARSEVPEEVKITTHDAIVEAGGRAIYKQTDVDVAEQVEDAVQTALEMFGSLGMYVPGLSSLPALLCIYQGAIGTDIVSSTTMGSPTKLINPPGSTKRSRKSGTKIYESTLSLSS
jgi:hypothetical protein